MSASRKPSEARPEKMGSLARMPVFYALQGKRCVLVGDGQAVDWKLELLEAVGAQVERYAVDGWSPDDLRGAAMAIGGIEDDDRAAAFAAAARAAGVPVNVIDKPGFCDFSFGAIVNRSPLVIGISTDGAAPVFAQAIRAKLESLLPNGFAHWAAAAARWRSMVKESGLSFVGRRKFWQVFTAHAVANPQNEPSDSDFARFVAEVKGLGAAVENGSVTLVGAGPGDPELLTLRAVRALQSADVILFDDLVSRDVLDFARREARKMLVGKTGFGPSCKQEDINTLMVGLAKQGKRVVRLKGGDPLIFGRAAEEIDACKAANIAVDIVPGITAAQGAAAKLGIPLTDRDNARRLQYVTGHARSGKLPDDIDWRALADPTTTTAIYMPVKTLEALVAKATALGLDPTTPALAISRATRPDQKVVSAPIAELSARITQANLPGPVLVMLGHAMASAQSVQKVAAAV
jgi:uroporphyrin-III C-methyltransferase/precorrin-2 dehydrogenase/sirohydrochlorin ferrochelatase